MIQLTPKGARRWRSGHPWIFRSDLAAVPTELEGGELVAVHDARGRPLGHAAYSAAAQLAVRRMPSADWSDLIKRAVARRVDRPPCARLVNGDADGLPGLIVDRYGSALSVQTLTQAAERRQRETLAQLDDLLAPAVIALRNDVKVRRFEDLPQYKSLAKGEQPEVIAPIGDLKMHFDLLGGQKTGGFLDQTENRLQTAAFARGDTLDCFCYQGGFALQMAAAGCAVTAVDASAAAIARLSKNVALNGLCVSTLTANVFDVLRQWDAPRFDTIVLDPPAFAKSRKSAAAGRRAYKEINLRAFKLLRPGGRLITCSCSAHMPRGEFERVVAEAAADAGRMARIVDRRGAAPDHPTLLGAPETDYLKVLFIDVL